MLHQHLCRLFVLAACISLAACSSTMPVITLISPDQTKAVHVAVEIADTAAKRERGLMYREELDEDTGMLFVFEKPQILTFWMRNTRIPLEILYFDEQGRFINAHTMQPCTTQSCPTYDSVKPVLYALEVNTGFLARNGIGEDWTLDKTQISPIAGQ